jgi:hypothetical protein
MTNEQSPAPAKPVHLDGLGPKTCASACNPEKGCAITGDMCGHPFQSGLQAVHKMKPDVIRRHAEALEHLEHLAVQRRAATAEARRFGDLTAA